MFTVLCRTKDAEEFDLGNLTGSGVGRTGFLGEVFITPHIIYTFTILAMHVCL